MALTITWYGHSSFGIDADGVKLVVDPFLKPNNPVALVGADQVAADFILLTHGHGDHVADAVPLAKRTGAQVICNFEIANWLGAHGVANTAGMNTGGAGVFPFGRVKLTIAHHSSSLPDGAYAGNPYGFLINFNDGHDLYIAGDTALTYDMKLIGDVGGVDVAILPIGDFFTMGPSDAVIAAQWVKAKHVIPCHYNTFPPIAVDAAAFARSLAREAGIDCTILAVGESATF
ncbi:MAG TPA: metal-dependent hydrolase [Chloroflexi bacterium]|nr:metal-dependent hydrolase [Chloroflexota bacterium]